MACLPFRRLRKMPFTKNLVRLIAISLLAILCLVLLDQKVQSAPRDKRSAGHRGPTAEKINEEFLQPPVSERTACDDKPTFMLHRDKDEWVLHNIVTVLQRLGYRKLRNSTSFDLLWSWTPVFSGSPFSVPWFRQKLKPFQKVNHYPGMIHIYNKYLLASAGVSYTPAAFDLPQDKEKLRQYSEQHPDALFVRKGHMHRGIKLVDVDQVLKSTKNDGFVQEFVQNPLLIDGHKFDIGVYTILTSLVPLRIYIYTGDIAIRFCRKEYEPFDKNDVKKYVISGDYKPIWEMPSLRRPLLDLKFSMRHSLEIYLKKHGINPDDIWRQMEDAITQSFLVQLPNMRTESQPYKNQISFFEMIRFDFVIDKETKVYLMEANLSPNMASNSHPENRHFFENILYNVYSLVGIGRRIRFGSRWERSKDEELMEVPPKSYTVFGVVCTSSLCNSCNDPKCSLCYNCMSNRTVTVLKQAYLEHVNRGDCKRIFPPSLGSNLTAEDLELEKYTSEDQNMIMWFLGKCLDDPSWC